MRAGNETTVERRPLLSYLSPLKVVTVNGRKHNFFVNFRFTLQILKEALKVHKSKAFVWY